MLRSRGPHWRYSAQSFYRYYKCQEDDKKNKQFSLHKENYGYELFGFSTFSAKLQPSISYTVNK